MTNYVIAIPSYKRSHLIQEKTLAYLKRTDVDFKKVYVFVSNGVEWADYMKAFELGDLPEGIHLVDCSAKNIVEKFNAIHRYFPVGTNVLVLEDDIDTLVVKTGKNSVEPFHQLTKLMQAGFTACHTHKTALWGVCPHSNPFYMKANITSSFKFVVANIYGFISTQKKDLEITLHAKSDYERTIRYFIEFGAIVRINHIGAVTKNYKNPGGLQDPDFQESRFAYEEQACEYLTTRYAHLAFRNEGKESMYPEIKLRTIATGGGEDWKAMQKLQDQRTNLKPC